MRAYFKIKYNKIDLDAKAAGLCALVVRTAPLDGEFLSRGAAFLVTRVTDQPPPLPSPPIGVIGICLTSFLSRPTAGCSWRWSSRRPHNIRFWDIRRRTDALGHVEKSIYSAEYQRLCAVLRELRKEAGLTQVQVAAALDVPQSFVSKYESGERRLDVIELHHVALVLRSSLRTVVERLGL